MSATICLRLVFISCHPVLSPEARIALTLRLLGGLSTDEIARAFLVPEPTIAQRIVRAKRTLAEAGVPFEVPRGAELAERLASVLEVDLPHLQRGLCGDRRRRLDAAAALRGGAAARPHPGRPRARRAGGARPRRADGDPGVARARPHRSGRRAGAAARPEPRAVGPAADPPRAGRACPRRGARRERSGPMRCRPRSPPAMRAPARPATPTGSASRRSMRCCRDDAVADRRAQPRHGGRHGGWARPPAWRSSTA